MVPGEILREVKISYALEQLHAKHPSAEGLNALLEKRFGTSLIQLLDSEELVSFIDSLLIDSKLRVEPQFFRSHTGHEYAILILVEGVKE
jgi:hypothetical protein